MWNKLFLMGLLIEATFGASLIPCPESCSCVLQSAKEIEIECTSLDFLGRLTPKQINAITKLNISNSDLGLLNPKLKHLKNLVSLDVSNNKLSTISPFPSLPKLQILDLSGNILKNIKVSELPLYLETVNISNNHISYISEDWSSLNNLKHLKMNNNHLDCDCETLLTYEKLNNLGIFDNKRITCFTPNKFKGKELKTLNCSMITEHLLNSMLGDEGTGNGITENTIDESDSDNISNEDQDYFTTVTDSIKDTRESEQFEINTNEKLEEGSGDEGSGNGALIEGDVIHPKACHFNCSTVNPLGINDTEDSSPEPPPIKEQTNIVFDDVFGSSDNTEHEKAELNEENTVNEVTEESPVTEVYEDSKQLIPIEPIPHNEKEKEKQDLKNNDKDDVETFTTTDVVEGEMERASVIGKSENSSSTYYVLGGIAFLFIALIVLVVIKKRSHAKKNAKAPIKENGHYQEMKPLGKSAEKPIEKKIINTAENTPLMSEPNGKVTENGDSLVANVDDDDFQDAISNDLKPNNELLLTPHTERVKVTVKVGEISDSVPKTPLIVHRQLNSDGNYTTSPAFQS